LKFFIKDKRGPYDDEYEFEINFRLGNCPICKKEFGNINLLIEHFREVEEDIDLLKEHAGEG
jgi:hypothetical protein